MHQEIDLGDKTTITQFIEFVKCWWIDHILDEDKKFQGFVLEKGYK